MATNDIKVVGNSKILVNTLDTGPEPNNAFTILILKNPKILDITVNNITANEILLIKNQGLNAQLFLDEHW